MRESETLSYWLILTLHHLIYSTGRDVQYVLTHQGVKSGNDHPLRFETAMHPDMFTFDDEGPVTLEACKAKCTQNVLCRGECGFSLSVC